VKVCYLMSRLLPTPLGAVVGGSAANCVSLALELKRQGVDIELLASVSSDGVAHLAGGPLAEIVRPLAAGGMGLIGKGLGALHSLRWGLKKRLREKRFDVVHSHSGTYPYAVVPLAADGSTCIRLHSLYCPIGAEGGLYSRWWERPLLACAILTRLDRVVAVTGNVRQSIERMGVPPERIESIPMCVDTQRFQPATHRGPFRYFSGNGDSVRLLFVGNASKDKGLLELLQAVRLLWDRRVPVSLVATVENQCAIEENAQGFVAAHRFVAEASLQKCVRFVGLIDSMETLYAESDIVVIPWNSTRGPSDYPMVALEAMAMGKCVVSTPVGGCPELLARGTAGVLASGFSPGDIAAAIESAVRAPQDRRRIEQAAHERSRQFSLIASADHHLALYERLRREKARHGRPT
jgi:glycosyltransferase involved in cell wall biosynthesis